MPSDGKESSEELRRRSKLLLGSGYQAEVGAVIADAAGPIWGKELSECSIFASPTKG